MEEEGSTTDVEAIDNYNETGFTDLFEDEVEAATGIYVTTVRLKLEGAREDLQRFIDDLSKSEERHLLKSYSWSSGTNMRRAEDGSYTAESYNFLSLELDIYECKE